MPRKPADVVGFVVARVAAAAAAILIVIVVAGFFLAHQASGPVASWATASESVTGIMASTRRSSPRSRSVSRWLAAMAPARRFRPILVR